MKRLAFGSSVVVIAALVAAACGDSAMAEGQQKPVVSPSLSAVDLGSQGLPLLPRGGGGDELYAGNPTCVPVTNDNGVGIQGVFEQVCGDGQWLSLAFPVLTGGATIESVNVIFSTAGQADSGDLYLMGDCGNGPDTNNILFTGCGCLQETVANELVNFSIGEPIVDAPAIVWVVMTFRESVGVPIWFAAFDANQQSTNHGFGNLGGGGTCGAWDDLNDFGFGGCYWVSLVTAGSPGVPPCCDSPALCDGDVNGDGVVDPLDGGYVLARFGVCNDTFECPLGGGNPGECGEDPPPESCAQEPSADCCEVHSEPGCNAVCGAPDDGGVEACVCNVDDFCCMVTWDSACVEIVELFSCADCSDNNPDCAGDGGSDCCFANGTPGCDDQECEDLICGQDPFCCDSEWDQICADAAIAQCDICGGGGGECPDGGPDNDCCENVPVDPLSPGGSLTYNATLTGANATCAALGALGETWHAFDLSATADVSASHCGTNPVFGNAFIVIDTDCPCSGAFIFADNFNQDDCADGNWTLNYPGLPAGDYWTPIILDPGFGNDGPYVWNISAD